MIADDGRCDSCAGAVYGGQERHEAVRLFASALMAGQLALSPPTSRRGIAERAARDAARARRLRAAGNPAPAELDGRQ
jgi:hypothetical protein